MRTAWQVVAGLAGIVAVLAVTAPDTLGAVVPIALVLACPVSMLLMARTMSHHGRTVPEPERDDRDPGGRP